MQCDKCKVESSYWELNHVKWDDSNRHYWTSEHNRIRPMKALLCNKCLKKEVMRPESNAALIAAAPDMFEALQNALNVLAGIATGDLKTITADSNAIKLARAALQKAKGK